MTSYLGPDNPPPLSLISENYQRRVQVTKVPADDCVLFNLGDEYYSKMIKLLRLQAGLNIDDTICVVASHKSQLPRELERKLYLITTVLHLTIGTALYEDSPGLERNINVSILPINAEDYFSAEINQNKFDKIIISDGIEMVEDLSRFLRNAKSTLKNQSESSLIILHKTKELLTLPVFSEAKDNFEKCEIGIPSILEHLVELDFLVGWNIVALPIEIAKEKWLNQLYNHYPPIMETVATTNIYNGLRELIETSFKYSDFLVTLKDSFLLIVATVSELYSGYLPYKMQLVNEEFTISTPVTSKPIQDNLLRLQITSDIRTMLPENLDLMNKFNDIQQMYPQEWWGTIPSATMGHLDRSRINHNIK